jgi:endoplasmic reticulum junction formation protein lunapark
MYLIRASISAYYTYRIDTVTQRLEDQQAERTKTIDKLKAATKYDSTQELLEKYGGATPKPKKQAAPKTQKAPQAQPQRVSIGPPATANIPRLNQTPSQPPTPQASTPQPIRRIQTPLQHIQASPIVARQQTGQAEFAPNAFSAPPQYAQGGEQGTDAHWYDRVLDLLMGEDETSPKNRVVLICQNCRLVNGQAPPGTKSLTDLGKWRCFGCGAMNGEEDEAAKVVKEIKERIETQDQDEPVESIEEKESSSAEKKVVDEDESSSGKDKENTPLGESDDGDDAEDTIEVKPRRGRPRSSKKKA